jgi:hypothetical protein
VTGTRIAALLLETGVATKLARSVGASIAKGVGATARGVFDGAGNIGAGLAEGLGTNPNVGKLVGQGAVVGTGLVAAKKQKRRFDEWRYQRGMY